MTARSGSLVLYSRVAAGLLVVVAAGALSSITVARSTGAAAAAAYYGYCPSGSASAASYAYCPPATLVLTPSADANPVGTSHTVTATVEDATGQPVEGVTVRFTVTGSRSASGACSTDAAGRCSFTYQGPPLPGADVITAFADSDGDGTRDPGEPAGAATKTWVLPVSTPGHVTGGGRIAGPAGDVSFTVHAENKDGTLKGDCSVRDPAGFAVECLNVQALVVSGNRAIIFGDATQNGTSTMYAIEVTDNGEPGTGNDTFSIITAAGYSRGGVLTGGNIQVRPS